MNRNMQGEVFSRAELIAMAVACGAIEAHKVDRTMKTGRFHDLTRKHRHEMFMRGEAVLDTRPEPVKPFVRPTVDREVLAFFKVTV